MTAPYSIEQARYLQELYQHLAGTRLDNSNATIERIVVVPFDQASRQRFILYYMVMAHDAQDVVLSEYKGFLFDLLIISRSATGELIYKDLAAFLANALSENNTRIIESVRLVNN